MSRRWDSIPRLTDGLTVSRNVTLTLALTLRQSPAVKNVSAEAEDIVGIHHQATVGEDVTN
jgi:hypothetical protein